MKTREEMVSQLIKTKIPSGLIEYVAKKERSDFGEGIMNSLSKMNDQAIRTLYYSIMEDKVEKEDYIVIRSALWAVKQFQSTKISIDHNVPNIGDFKITIANDDDEITAIIDCKIKAYELDNINEFIEKLRILKEKEAKLTTVYIISRNEFSDQTLDQIKNIEGMSNEGVFITKENRGLGGMMSRKPNKINFSVLLEKSKENYEKVFP
tara:strand:+ start:392 stop:1015 length:624 start_codon:yes stop_codon:yes gene_type:complete